MQLCRAEALVSDEGTFKELEQTIPQIWVSNLSDARTWLPHTYMQWVGTSVCVYLFFGETERRMRLELYSLNRSLGKRHQSRIRFVPRYTESQYRSQVSWELFARQSKCRANLLPSWLYQTNLVVWSKDTSSTSRSCTSTHYNCISTH